MPSHATIDEILETFASLSAADMKALCLAAAIHMRGSQFTEPIDLIHETLNLLLDGRRNWPKRMEFGPFMFATMRSVADADRQLVRNRLASNARVEDLLEQTFIERFHTPSVEEQLLAQEPGRIVAAAAREARAALEGDNDARGVIDGMLADLSPKEICESYKVEPALFDGARKRAVRRIRKHMGATPR